MGPSLSPTHDKNGDKSNCVIYIDTLNQIEARPWPNDVLVLPLWLILRNAESDSGNTRKVLQMQCQGANVPHVAIMSQFHVEVIFSNPALFAAVIPCSKSPRSVFANAIPTTQRVWKMYRRSGLDPMARPYLQTDGLNCRHVSKTPRTRWLRIAPKVIKLSDFPPIK